MRVDPTTSMLRALCVAVLVTSACGGGQPAAEAPAAAPEKPEAPVNLLLGTWNADPQAMAMASLPEGQEPPPALIEALKDSYIKVTFNEDGTNDMEMKMGPEANTESGTYAVLSQEGKTYKLKLTSKTGDGSEKTQEATAVFTDDDNVTITLAGEAGAPPMILSRQK